jgi:hypothetical protein
MRYFIYVALFMIAFTLYSRSYCHLCDDMLEQLRAYTADYQFLLKLLMLIPMQSWFICMMNLYRC